MENQQQNTGQQNAQQTPALGGQPTKPGTPLPKDTSKSNRKFLIGCLGAFGCSVLLFIGVLFAFLGFGSTDNPIFGFLGSTPGEVTNVLITLINFIFLVLVFVSFILVVIGIFKITTAKKDDKEARRKGAVFTFVSLSIMILFILLWIVAYFFLASKRTPVVRTPITTVPEKTINLTAPVTIRFDASKAPINTKQFDVLSYNWDFGDKTESTGIRQSHTFPEVGNYKVIVTITVKEKTTGRESEVQFSRDVTIQNVRANVIIEADKTSGTAPLTINLNGEKSSSPNGEIISYEWDLNDDNQYDDGTSSETQVTLDKIGAYTIGLRVTDSAGEFSTGSIEIEVTPPDNPVAVIKVEGLTGSSTELEVNTAYTFSAADSVSPTGTIEKYSWEFGDNGKASTRTATHTYREPGEYEIVLKITDSRNKKGETAQRFSVSAQRTAPLVSIKTTPEPVNNIVSGQAPFNVIFDASESQDPNENIVEYAWDFDSDGQKDDSNSVTSHTFTNPGTYNVRLTITDSTELSTNGQIVIRVESPGLRANITAEPIAGIVPLTVSFDASGSSYPDGRIVSYEWDFGDGAPPRTDTSRVSHQYTAIGAFNAKVTAITSDSKRASAEIPINVRAVPVKACFTPNVNSGTSPVEVEFDPTCSTGTVVRYRWNFANLRQSSERKPKFTFREPGEYNISLEVADATNVVDTFTAQITITAPR